MDNIKVLQLGRYNYTRAFPVPDYVEYNFGTRINRATKTIYDVVILDKPIEDSELPILIKQTRAYGLFVTAETPIEGNLKKLFDFKEGKVISRNELKEFFTEGLKNYFEKSYGEKSRLNNFVVSRNFKGQISQMGGIGLSLYGDFSSKMSQVAYLRNNLPLTTDQPIEFWLEYQSDDTVHVALEVTQIRSGSLSDVVKTWTFDENALKETVVVDNPNEAGYLFMSIKAMGEGGLVLCGLHDRFSRKGEGVFLPGGDRYITSEKEEIFCYFDPGDMKPPLNVYFSGYKTQEGFEGYYMMRKLGAPFLLVAEARLEGGGFYMGSTEYERTMVKAIQGYLDRLGFKHNELILSGISMGSSGALYYGCDFRPHAMIVGKPLASLGYIADNEALKRPGGFPTSLDVLNYQMGGSTREAIEALNKKFWDKFDQTDWSESNFVLSYMIEDDYDDSTYEIMLGKLGAVGGNIISRGVHGRHNDNSAAIVEWFVEQYNRILSDDFGRKK